ncbi:hypothetical protein cypCar_00047753 [Cyprinus carpio]|nr:hypothetical protein cypCar_00047753 [Cyprinus carpio]
MSDSPDAMQNETFNQTVENLRTLCEENEEKKKKITGELLNIEEKYSLKLSTEVKVVNDSIHGHIELHPLLVKIIDTPQFQRLRHIKQLGGAYWVFPGASHNRFEHSIGVAYLAGCMVKSLQEKQPELHITNRDILCVTIAGLCHDLGHGPFSHLFDKKFIPAVQSDAKWKWPADCGRNEDKAFLYEIVANKRNSIDVDKWDYFARITEALVEADGHFKISKAKDNMEDYTKLTDHILEKIVYPDFGMDKKLEDARKKVNKILKRDLPKFLGEAKLDKRKFSEFVAAYNEIQITIPDTTDIKEVHMDHSMKGNNPMNNVYFYSKHDPNKAFLKSDQMFLPMTFYERLFRVYYKGPEEKVKEAQQCFEMWRSNYFSPNV